MDILIQAQHPEAHALRDLVNSRMRFSTQRLSRFVSRAVVRFTDLNGPRGGVDKQCQIQLSTANGDVLVVSSRGADWRATLETTIARATQVLARRFNAQKKRFAGKPGVLAAQSLAAA